MSRVKWWQWGLAFITVLLIVIVVWSLNQIPSPLFPDDYSTMVLDENQQILRVFLNDKQQWHLPEHGQEIGHKLKTAVVLYEDKRFEQHFGVDLLAVGRAVYQNLSTRTRVSGASTLTMQVARLIQPKKRTIANKIVEMIQAVALEIKFSKAEILKLYLLHAPYGSNIIGYQTAALRYFGVEPDKLSWAQAATLAVLPNNPANVNPMRNQEQLQVKRDSLLTSLYEAGEFDHETYLLALAEPVPQGQHAFALAAPHLTERLARQSPEHIVETTINKQLQDEMTLLVKDYVAELSKQGVNNGALLIADTISGEIKAYIASHDYFDQENAGMIDGVMMKRSAGSTLKPFLYALAMDEGLLIPESLLPDIPINYGAYTPYNADGKFDGVVRAKDALTRSLNAPAVNLLNVYGVEQFYRFLQASGLELVKTADEYGLSLILGSADVSLWELVRLYRGLGNLGNFSDIHVVKNKVQNPPQQLVSAGSAYLTLDMLQDVARPGMDLYWRDFTFSTPLAWKTGTSYGNRDAWAVGVSPQWTIAVWVGNFSGEEVSELFGASSAAPLLFLVFNQLEKNTQQSWFTVPEGELTETTVSVTTGYRIDGSLGTTTTAKVSAQAKPLRLSPYEKILYLNKAGTMEVCSLCWDRLDVQTVQRVIYPAPVILYLGATGINYTIPPHNTKCSSTRADNPLVFVYPQPGSQIFVPRDSNNEYQKVKMQVAHGEKPSEVFWYLDNSYLGKTVTNHEMSMVLTSGWHNLYVIDAAGNNRSVSFYAERN